jgi:hypothetical protein
MIKGIIYSLMRNYKRQNTHYSDYKNMATKLFKRHVARGWDRTFMKGLILQSDARLEQQQTQSTMPTTTTTTTTLTATPLDNKERLFLHFEYHRCDIPKAQVRAIFDSTCKELLERRLDIKQLTICYSRPTNIREAITKAKLHQAPGREASKFYEGELP